MNRAIGLYFTVGIIALAAVEAIIGRLLEQLWPVRHGR